MDTSKLKKFAQFARRNLIEQVQSKLKLVLADESAARREHPKAVKELEQKINQSSNKKDAEEQLIELVAYTWFNRFCALRFMDVNQYNRIMVLSPISGQFQPEILAEAKAGHLDDSVFNDKARGDIQGLLSGSVPSRDGQAEAYRLIIVAVCNDYHRLMPFLFQRIEDYTELLMPDDLLSGNSILAYTREAMTPENCESVESIGWLYQFYISEKKDLVFEGLKKNKKITPENIPAATQLFTPHWIVKYLVENSLGRLWMLNNPNSKIIEHMEYYIKPVEDEVDFLKVGSPEELKICDSACGSGHILTYAYDLLYAIYLDSNYDPVDIPELILTKNLYGIEIDERASELAAFALSMKALKGNPNGDGNNRRRFFRNPIKPNICRLEKVKIDEDALKEYMDFIGRELFTHDFRVTLTEFEEADNFGSLIQPTLNNISDVLAIIEEKGAAIDFSLDDTHKSVLKILKQAEYLRSKYSAVIINPPYMGKNGMNERMSVWLKENYNLVKSDLFSSFIVRVSKMTLKHGSVGIMCPNVWMYISSFLHLRKILTSKCNLTNLVELPLNGFKGATVQICAFNFINRSDSVMPGNFIRLVDFKSGNYDYSELTKEAVKNPDCEYIFRASKFDFEVIPGNTISYWASKKLSNLFKEHPSLAAIAKPKQGLATTDNDRFLRFWFECSQDQTYMNANNSDDSLNSKKKWFPIQKGGAFRKWYGNNEYVVNWFENGVEIKDVVKERYGSASKRVVNEPFYFKTGITWSSLSSSSLSMRYVPNGYIFETKGSMCFFEASEQLKHVLAFFNSNIVNPLLECVSPTLDYHEGPIGTLPISQTVRPELILNVDKAVEISKIDWNESEVSWEFTSFSLLKGLTEKNKRLQDQYSNIRENELNRIENLRQIEVSNNKILINDYSLDGELPTAVDENKITLNCNSAYRFPNTVRKTLSVEERESLYKKVILVEFISYSVGCVFGRFSTDEEGLILANQGDTIENYLSKIPSPTFMPDKDNVIPIIDFDGDWFEDDITERFKAFLKATFGEEHFAENLAFIEEAIGKDIKKYFVKDFYTDHVKRYKKRPIYWMFSSPKGSFNALIYMHRYQPDTASVVLNDYLREFRTKLEARKESYEQVEISASASQKDITQAIKAIAKIDKVLEEVNDYEHGVLYPLAGKNIEIDLDDGVKHNYPLFGKALKKVAGLS